MSDMAAMQETNFAALSVPSIDDMQEYSWGDLVLCLLYQSIVLIELFEDVCVIESLDRRPRVSWLKFTDSAKL